MATKAKSTRSTKKPPKGKRNGPGRPTLQDLNQRKSTILEVATTLFIEKGYAESSLLEIAKQSGVATRTIYQHFGNKEDLFRAVIEDFVGNKDYQLPEINSQQSLLDSLMVIAHYICRIAIEESAMRYQRLMIAESQRFPSLMQHTFDSLFQNFHGRVISLFEQLEEMGKIPAGDHTETTKFFIDLLLGTAPLQLSMNWIESGPTDTELRRKVSLFIAGKFGINPDS